MRIGLTCLMVVSLAGCGLELLTTTAIQGELAAQSAGTAAQALDYAQSSVTLNNAQRAIDAYRAETGKNPPSLEALVPGYLASVPMRADGSPYGYDPVSGRILDGPVATPAPAAGGGSGATVQEVAAAVQRYGQENGAYPPSLWSLVPNYLSNYPKTASGQDFLYDPRTGQVYAPQAAAQAPAYGTPQAAPRGGVGASGVGPLGEAMTGIGIANQLGSMSNAGSASASGYAAGNLGRTQAQHNANQERALQDLGF